MRATLIVNPYASSVSEERVRDVERELGAAYELETLLTERRGHATELTREAQGEVIFAFGGDGVFNEVVNGADGTKALGFVPGGGTSVLPRALGFPRDPVEAVSGMWNSLWNLDRKKAQWDWIVGLVTGGLAASVFFCC